VPFEADHLRRVLINLLDNASRYASALPASIRVLTQRVGRESSLRVWSDGPPLEVTVRQHLFEPFFSSESRSSGLGLYICRELCERHGAQIGYRRGSGPGAAPRQGNEFFVVFAAGGPALAGNSSFDTIPA
jgi:two-component system sensor histidine kinase PilS (NtrC family)